MSRLAHRLSAIAVALTAIALSACKQPEPAPEVPLTLSALGIGSDSIVAPGFSLVSNGKELIYSDSQICSRISATPVDQGRMWLAGGDSLLCLLFNGQVQFPAEETASDSTVTPLRLWLGEALTDPESARAACMKRLRYGQYLSEPFRGYSWPVISDWAEWLFPVEAVTDATGDTRFATAWARAIRPIIAADEEVTYDPDRSLYRGADRSFVKYFNCAHFDAADLAASLSLRTNIEKIKALQFASRYEPLTDYTPRTDSMKIAVETLFRNPRRRSFNHLLYQQPYPIAYEGCDNLAIALGVISHTFSPEAAQMAVWATPTRSDSREFYGIIPYYPLVNQPDSEYQALCNALWSIASAQEANNEAFALSYAAAIFDAIKYPQLADIFQGATLRGLLGISTSPNHLNISPFIPVDMSGNLELHNFRYRDALFDIYITGHGNIASRVTLDGIKVPTSQFDATLTGSHEIHITLSASTNTPSQVTDAPAVAIPPIPEVKAEQTDRITMSGDSAYAVYLDGCLWQVDDDTHFEIMGDGWSDGQNIEFVTVAGCETDIIGFAPDPYFYCDDQRIVRIPAHQFAHLGTRVFKDKRLNRLHGKEFVESTQFRNARLCFEFDAPEAGRYYLTFSYVSGLGIVNPGLKYSLRSLQINDLPAGVIVFPQLTPDAWLPTQKWWERTAQTLPIAVDLLQGRNTFSLTYYAPPFSHLTNDTNILLPLKLILTKSTERRGKKVE